MLSAIQASEVGNADRKYRRVARQDVPGHSYLKYTKVVAKKI